MTRSAENKCDLRKQFTGQYCLLEGRFHPPRRAMTHRSCPAANPTPPHRPRPALPSGPKGLSERAGSYEYDEGQNRCSEGRAVQKGAGAIVRPSQWCTNADSTWLSQRPNAGAENGALVLTRAATIIAMHWQRHAEKPEKGAYMYARRNGGYDTM